MRFALFLVLAGGFASQATAERAGAINGRMLLCTLAPACADCAPGPIAIDIAVPGILPGRASLLPETGPAEGLAYARESTLVVGARDARAAYLLTRDQDGATVLSVQSSAPTAVATYAGTCRVAE
ncbi:hypothetical protein [Roseicitreum antarcticum]|uniref:Uncharacterized protein n=1 Tax=Roseicitreum antarcticum TaxID=564137 RepID=A0A1H3CGE9_9RHOB|nr:hypothetical protein [Roseicitreum antarcticum]SDX52664.1 hypothetical protein SAMN04488238_109139 [Roseicitreum antarcticum]